MLEKGEGEAMSTLWHIQLLGDMLLWHRSGRTNIYHPGKASLLRLYRAIRGRPCQIEVNIAGWIMRGLPRE